MLNIDWATTGKLFAQKIPKANARPLTLVSDKNSNALDAEAPQSLRRVIRDVTPNAVLGHIIDWG